MVALSAGTNWRPLSPPSASTTSCASQHLGHLLRPRVRPCWNCMPHRGLHLARTYDALNSSASQSKRVGENLARQNSPICAAKALQSIVASVNTERRVGARSPGKCPSLSVTPSVGITSRLTLDAAPLGLVCWRPVGRWSRFLSRQHPEVARAHHAGTGARYVADADGSAASE